MRAGVGQIFINDLDDAMEDARWIKEHGLRGGVLLPNVPPDVKWVKPLHDTYYDPLWKLCEDLEIPVQCHGGTGNPDYGNTPVSGLLYITETSFYSQRPLVHMILGGVFERFPKLKLVLTEMGCAWIPGVLAQLDGVINSIRSTRSIGELRYTDDQVLNHTATEYVQRNVWVGASQPRPADAAAREVLGEHRFMWGSDYPHDEGTHPFTREHLRQVFADTPPDGAPADPRRATPPSSSSSTSARCRRRPTATARRSRRSPRRSPSCPTTPTRRCGAARAPLCRSVGLQVSGRGGRRTRRRCPRPTAR